MKEETRIKINDNEMCIKGIDEVPMFSWNIKTKEFYVLGHKFDGINSIEDFINYIHNLDKENKSLQSQLKAKEETINKAIEYINENLIISCILDGKKYYTINDYSFDYRELLDILKEVSE